MLSRLTSSQLFERIKRLRDITDGRPANLEVRDLDVFHGPIQTLWGISLEVRDKEAVAILGANGAGKTTLLRAISGIHRPRRGEIRFAGTRIVGRPGFEIVRCGIVHIPEGRRLFTGLTVLENLWLGATTRENRLEIREDVEWMFEVFSDLYDKRHRLAGELSGGQQQMVAIARGLMAKPRLLCLDEPSLGLSPRLVEQSITLIDRVRRERNTGILLVEQNAAMALEIADRAYVMERGRVVRMGTPQDLLSTFDLRSSYLGEGPTPKS